MVMSPVQGLNFVSDLMREGSGSWNCTLIESVFSTDEARLITGIPIPKSPLANKLVWSFEKSGVYLVKSGYRCLMHDSRLNEEERNLFRQL